MRHTTALLLPALLGAVAGISTPARAAALQLLEPGALFASAPYTLGFAFSVNEALHLVALGVYDHQDDGLEAAAEVALWIDGQPGAIVTALVPSGATAMLDGGFRYLPVATTLLAPGTVYVVGAYLDGGWATSFGLGQQGQAQVDTRLQLLGDRFGDGFFAITYPGQSDSATGAWLGANFQISAVPEPAAAGLLLAGLAGLAWRQRKQTAGRSDACKAAPRFPG